MHNLVLLGLAAVSIVKAALQETGNWAILHVDADFDDLTAQGPGHPIYYYGELAYSEDFYVDDLNAPLNRNPHGMRHILSGNNVAFFPDTIAHGVELPTINATWRKGVVDSYKPESLNWGCYSSHLPCQLVVTGHRGGSSVVRARATFTESPAVFGSDFDDVSELRFHPHRAGYARQATPGVIWIDDFRYTYYYSGKAFATAQSITTSISTTTPTISDVFTTINSYPAITPPPLEQCFSGLNDCLEPISTCFSDFEIWSFGFPFPDTNLCSTRVTTTVDSITSVDIDTDLPITTDPADWDPATWCEICVDNIDECGQTFGGCFNTCNGEVPTFEAPSCSLTATDVPITTETSIVPGTETPTLPIATPTSAPIDHTIPLSEDGRCGTDVGAGSSFNERCGDDACCSMWGWCGPGPSSDWCDTCQPGFGLCTRPIFEAQPLLRVKAKNVTHHH